MTTLDENLITFVKADTSIQAKIGDRMFHGHIPQGTAFPRIYITRSGTVIDGALDDAAGSDPNRETFTLEIQARDERDAETLRGLVVDRLNCYRGALGDTTVQGIFAADFASAHVPEGTGTDTGIWTVSGPVEVVL